MKLDCRRRAVSGPAHDAAFRVRGLAMALSPASVMASALSLKRVHIRKG